MVLEVLKMANLDAELPIIQKVYMGGETENLKFTNNEELLKFYTASEKWEAENGEFELMIGGNSEEVQTVKFNFSK